MIRSSGEIAIEHLLRELAPQVLGSVIRRFHDFAAAEDAVQEAMLAAVLKWPREGIPEYPRGWLIQVAARRMTDYFRSEEARRRREEQLGVTPDAAAPAPSLEEQTEQDETLTLFFLCCHPSLTAPSAIALTLRAVGGLTTSEIASAFLVPESTMAQRISRVKHTIKTSGVPFQLPHGVKRAENLRAVLHVLYLMFNEGYTTSAGPNLQRLDLSTEAIRLARSVYASAPENPEVAGLLALMLLTDARRHARTGRDGELVSLMEQDRNLWDGSQVTEGIKVLTAALSKGSAGVYQLQAAIAAVHDEAPRAEETDWPQILALYELLKRMSDNPMIRLNYSVAVAMVHGAAKALDLLNALDAEPRIAGHYRLDVVRDHLFEMSGDHETATIHFRLAAVKTTSIPERDYLLRQAARAGGRP